MDPVEYGEYLRDTDVALHWLIAQTCCDQQGTRLPSLLIEGIIYATFTGALAPFRDSNGKYAIEVSLLSIR